jgi:hypothetical protein
MSSTVNATPHAARFGLKQLAIGALLVGLGAVAAVAMVRESRQGAPAAAQAAGGAFTGHQGAPSIFRG